MDNKLIDADVPTLAEGMREVDSCEEFPRLLEEVVCEGLGYTSCGTKKTFIKMREIGMRHVLNRRLTRLTRHCCCCWGRCINF
jgi:hypothetical protein